jgi:hypothetical protein
MIFQDLHSLVEPVSDLESLDLLGEHLGKLVIDIVTARQIFLTCHKDVDLLDVDSVCCSLARSIYG